MGNGWKRAFGEEWLERRQSRAYRLPKATVGHLWPLQVHGKANPTRGIPTLKCQAAGVGGERAGPVLPEALTLALEMAAATRSISSRYLLLRSLPTVAPTPSE